MFNEQMLKYLSKNHRKSKFVKLVNISLHQNFRITTTKRYHSRQKQRYKNE